MKRFIGAVRDALDGIGAWPAKTDVEGFVRLIFVGGVALVVGLWVVVLSPAWSVPWSLGLLVSLLGTAGLAGGIYGVIDL